MKLLAASFIISLVGFSFVASAAAQCQPEKVAEKFPALAGKTLNIGTTPFYPPYEYVDKLDPEKMIGSDIEISEAALQCVGLKYKYTKGVFSSLLPALTNGHTDAVIGNVYYRPERAKVVDFIIFMKGGGALLVRKGNPHKIKSMDDLCGLNTNAVSGSYSQPILEKQSAKCVSDGKKPVNVVVATETDAALRGLASGRADFVLDNVGGAAVRVAEDPVNLEIAFTRVEDVDVGIVVNKGNEALLQAYYEGMKAVQENGTMKKIFEKYKLDPSLIAPVAIKR